MSSLIKGRSKASIRPLVTLTSEKGKGREENDASQGQREGGGSHNRVWNQKRRLTDAACLGKRENLTNSSMAEANLQQKRTASSREQKRATLILPPQPSKRRCQGKKRNPGRGHIFNQKRTAFPYKLSGMCGKGAKNWARTQEKRTTHTGVSKGRLCGPLEKTRRGPRRIVLSVRAKEEAAGEKKGERARKGRHYLQWKKRSERDHVGPRRSLIQEKKGRGLSREGGGLRVVTERDADYRRRKALWGGSVNRQRREKGSFKPHR